MVRGINNAWKWIDTETALSENPFALEVARPFTICGSDCCRKGHQLWMSAPVQLTQGDRFAFAVGYRAMQNVNGMYYVIARNISNIISLCHRRIQKYRWKTGLASTKTEQRRA